jgi:hypothetical protein
VRASPWLRCASCDPICESTRASKIHQSELASHASIAGTAISLDTAFSVDTASPSARHRRRRGKLGDFRFQR